MKKTWSIYYRIALSELNSSYIYRNFIFGFTLKINTNINFCIEKQYNFYQLFLITIYVIIIFFLSQLLKLGTSLGLKQVEFSVFT